MGKIDTLLSSAQLDTLRHAYSKEDMVQLLSSGIPGLDDRTTEFIGAIRKAFYDGGAGSMSAKDRERCLIAILASRDAGLNLALHVYCGLMEGLSPQEIADVIFLGGIYTGVDRISDGLAAEMTTLTVLAHTAVPPMSCTVSQVVQALIAAFRPPPRPQ
jgi:alkylhydroperoxidase/carboxymuconolactone decarboxylase family protein YurZ